MKQFKSNPLSHTIGINLYKLRIYKGLTRIRAAAIAGIKYTRLERLERGYYSLDRIQADLYLDKLCKLYGVNEHFLLNTHEV